VLISTKHKKLVLRLRDPNRVLSVIPKSKLFKVDGKEYIAVPHGVDEIAVLNNLGIDAPSPILYYYDWPGRFDPYAHQKETAAFFTKFNRSFCLNEMGTGKTMSLLWAYDYLRSVGAVKKMLVVTPLSTIERTWADEIFDNFPHLDFVVLHGTRSKRFDLLETDADIYLINHDGVKVSGFVDAMAKRPDIDLVVVDEISQAARNGRTDRFKALSTIINRQVSRRAIGMTGTPTPNAPTDAWAQCRLIVPERITPYFNKFRDQVMRQVSTYKWVPRENATEIVHEAMQPAIRFTLEECVDLPECVYETRHAELSKQQESAYKDMLNKLHIEMEQGVVTAANEAVKAQKLIQVACGCVYDNDGNEIDLDAGPRLNVLLEAIEQANAKVIVFVPFRSTVTKILEGVKAAGFTADAIHGRVSKSARDTILSDFQRKKDPRVLVAQPGTMSHGLTLTAANTIVWYAPITSNDIFSQANARVRRPGQKHTQLIVMIEGTPIERKYYSRLKEKEKVQGLLLDIIKNARISP
jgi:SNF2 family DNA or RNA helicase